MRKYDYNNMTRAISQTESVETREMLVLLEMDWSPAQVLQFFRERDHWKKTSVVSVQPVTVTTKEDEAPVYKIVETVNDQITDAVITKEPAAGKKKA